MSGSVTEVAKARFKKAFGYGVADVLVDRSLDRATKEVSALRTEVARLQRAGLSSDELIAAVARTGASKPACRNLITERRNRRWSRSATRHTLTQPKQSNRWTNLWSFGRRCGRHSKRR
jgi:hypothetical protein